ncbi:MAG TPA: D-aminoacyl-tRNA deacylase [Rubricoccaceae bacterium]
MIALVQRARSARVVVDSETVGEIGPGLLVLLGVVAGDTDAEARWLADKTARLRVFRDDEGRMNRSLLDTGGDALVVSQFTLAGDASKGTRPSFVRAAAPDDARRLYERFVADLRGALGRPVPTGRFGADMEVTLVGDGPVTIWLERAPAA